LRQRVAETLATQGSWQSEILSVANGKRRNLQIMVHASGALEAGCALDAQDSNFTHREVERVTEAHQRTLDYLHTAVAIFGADRKLVYHNPAWEHLWQLEPSFLAERPEEGVLLDHLRQQRKLPEQADYKSWKAQHLETYASMEPREVWWHLPDGRTLRVFTLPNPQGGITLVQENVTEVLDLKSRAAASERMQRETLDALTDAVAVFGLDGRLKLTNPALLKMWRLEQNFVAANPHINDVIAKGMTLYANALVWAEIKQSVIAFGEERKTLTRQIELYNGTVIDLACVPLPDGATLITFVDVTASVSVERVLK
jgi:PAS domain-containing protein